MRAEQTIPVAMLVISISLASFDCGGDEEVIRIIPGGLIGPGDASPNPATTTSPSGSAGSASTTSGSMGVGGDPTSGSSAAGSGGSTGSATGGGDMMAGTGGESPTGSGGSPVIDAGTVMESGPPPAPDGGPPVGPLKVLIWNNALTYGHQSRMTAIPLLQAQAAANNIEFDTTYAHTQTLAEGTVDSKADYSVFTDSGLDKYDVVFFLNTTGNTMDGDGMATVHRQALTDFIQKKGRGYVGTHSATDTYDSGWTWYSDFVGANFSGKHSNANTSGSARWYTGVTHPILTAANVPNPWSRSEEWYAFTRDPLSSSIPGIKILLTCTDSSNQFGERPITWVHDMNGGGRMFYTGFGHFVSAFQEKDVMNMIIAGIKWAGHRI